MQRFGRFKFCIWDKEYLLFCTLTLMCTSIVWIPSIPQCFIYISVKVKNTKNSHTYCGITQSYLINTNWHRPTTFSIIYSVSLQICLRKKAIGNHFLYIYKQQPIKFLKLSLKVWSFAMQLKVCFYCRILFYYFVLTI